MILRRFLTNLRGRTIGDLYGAIVAQARSPSFYAVYGVPDTVEGRFDLIVLHLVLVLDALGGEAGAGRSLGQGLFDAFCRDLDANLREMGVGDLAVPKRMRRFGEAFYGRQTTYATALAAPDDGELESALARNIFGGGGGAKHAARLARYARAAVIQLKSARAAALLRGELVFPNPETIDG
jgi:cytochrome b pre-mRNA-processing protein 3